MIEIKLKLEEAFGQEYNLIVVKAEHTETKNSCISASSHPVINKLSDEDAKDLLNCMNALINEAIFVALRLEPGITLDIPSTIPY
jgi:glycerate-2-kinase